MGFTINYTDQATESVNCFQDIDIIIMTYFYVIIFFNDIIKKTKLRMVI